MGILPAELSNQQFAQYFQDMQGPQRESQMTAVVKTSPAQWQMYLTKGFNLHVVPAENPGAPVMQAAGTLHTNTPNQTDPSKTICVACMVRLEYDGSRNMARITVRAAHGQCAQALGQILATYMMVPPSQAASGQAAPSN